MAFSWSFSSAETLNPNYGTTTFFSTKDAKPSANPPMYDVGASATGHDSSDENKNGGSSSSSGSLFGQIIGGIGSLFGNPTVPNDSAKTSLFDLQKNSDQNSQGDSSGNSSGEVIMGARGESLENMSADQIAAYNNKFSKMNFNIDSGAVAPKKSKLIFTNVIIPVDLTTQYVLIVFVFVIAVGGAIGYYFWKKNAEAEKPSNEEKSYYD